MIELLRFRGRVGRRGYFASIFGGVIALAYLPVALNAFLTFFDKPGKGLAVLLLGGAYVLAGCFLAWIGLAASSRRFQDLGVSGWWAALLLVPGVNLAAVGFLCLWPGSATTMARRA